MSNKPFFLDYAFHPGEMLKEKLEEMEMDVPTFSQLSGLTENVIEDVTSCKIPITEDIAVLLEKGTGIPTYLWLKLQHSFEEYTKRHQNDDVFMMGSTSFFQRLWHKVAMLF